MPESLFGDDLFDRPTARIAPGAVHVPGWLTAAEQAWLLDRAREWAAGPVPPRSALINGHPMSVRTVCLGWHWQAGGYSRAATDVNGNRVLPVPDWLVRLGRRALLESGHPAEQAEQYTPDTALLNAYDPAAKMGMHRDADERSAAPVVSLSLGESCVFRFGNAETRTRPYRDLTLASGDLFVFGGPARFAYHGVTKILPGTAPEHLGLRGERLNLTLRETGLR